GAVGVRRGRIARRPPEQLTAAGDEPMTDPDQVRLLFGPYRPPLLKRGDRAFCLVRDGDVVITSWSYSRIPWPRCRAAGTRGGGTGLVIDEERARPVLHESAPADCYWWGASRGAVSPGGRGWASPALPTRESGSASTPPRTGPGPSGIDMAGS